MSDIITDYFESKKYRDNVTTATFKKGEVILRPHDDINHIYAIATGLAKIYNLDSRGKEYLTVIYGPKDFYPLAWLIDHDRPPLYFKAITDCTIYVVSRKIFKKDLKESAELSNIFMQQVLEQFSYYASTVNNLGLKYARERLYYRLLVLGARYGQKQGNEMIIPYVSHNDLGVIIHMTREGISKELSNLEKLKVIEFNRKNIIIKDVDYLEKQLGKTIPIAFFDNF